MHASMQRILSEKENPFGQSMLSTNPTHELCTPARNRQVFSAQAVSRGNIATSITNVIFEWAFDQKNESLKID
jgi:hypothetical protein